MLESIDQSYRVLASEPGADATHIAAVQTCFGSVPPEYLEIVREATEIEMQHTRGQYIRIWGPTGCIEMNDAYHIRKQIPDAIPIGDDGGGHVIFYHAGKRGFGLYHTGWSNVDADDAVFIAPSLADFLTTATGIDTFQGQ